MNRAVGRAAAGPHSPGQAPLPPGRSPPALLGAPLARRFGRYSVVSMFNVVAGAAIMSLAFGVAGWSARWANLASTALVTLPSYLLNRAWVWGRSGRSHLVGEVLPFWALAFVGLGLSTLAAGQAEDVARHVTDARVVQTAIVAVSTIAAYGVVWVVKFAVLEYLLFSDGTTHPGVGGSRADAVA